MSNVRWSRDSHPVRVKYVLVQKLWATFQTLRDEIRREWRKSPKKKKNLMTFKKTMNPKVQDSPAIMTCPSLLARMFSSWVQRTVGVWVSEPMRAFSVSAAGIWGPGSHSTCCTGAGLWTGRWRTWHSFLWSLCIWKRNTLSIHQLAR